MCASLFIFQIGHDRMLVIRSRHLSIPCMAFSKDPPDSRDSKCSPPPTQASTRSGRQTNRCSIISEKSVSCSIDLEHFTFDLTFAEILEALQIAHSSSTCSKCSTSRCIPQGQASLARPYVALNSHRPRATGKRLNIMHTCA